MHEIEKELLVKQLAAEVWQNYCAADVLGEKIAVKDLKCCAIDAHARPSGFAGKYYPGSQIAYINTAYYQDESNRQSLRETIAHEIAHYLQCRLFIDAKQWHGPEFKWIMQCIGYDGSTFHSMNVASAKAVARKAKDELFNLD